MQGDEDGEKDDGGEREDGGDEDDVPVCVSGARGEGVGWWREGRGGEVWVVKGEMC